MSLWPFMKARSDAQNHAVPPPTTPDEWIFRDKAGGFQFDKPMWKNMHASDRERYRPDAFAHRDEAIRRKTVCRLESREKETAHWLSHQRFLENLFNLDPVE